MRLLRLALAKARALFHRDVVAGEIREEMQFHLRMREDQYRDLGLAPDDARRAASRRFGNLALMQDHGYDVKGSGLVETLYQDVRIAVRRLRKDGIASLVSIGTLAIGVGVVTASFAVVDAVLLEPVVHEQDRVVRIWKHDVERGTLRHPFTYYEFTRFRDRAESFERLAAIQYADANARGLTIDGTSLAALIAPVSADFHRTLVDGPPSHGRWLRAEDEIKGAELVGIVSDRFWRRVAGADPGFVGRRLSMADGRTLLVVGVAPTWFDYPIGTDFWAPIAGLFDGASRRFNYAATWFAHFELVGRLRQGVSSEQASAELIALSQPFETEIPDYRPMTMVVRPLLESVLGNGRQVLLFLLSGAALVLVIAGVNVAALLLMRASAHRKESAVRLALGATRAQLARQAVVSSLVLGAIAAVAGTLLAAFLLGVLRWAQPAGMPRIENASLDLGVLAFAVLAVLLWVVTLGAAPVWTYRRLEPKEAGDLVSRGRGRTAGLRVFTVAELAAAVTVAVLAGLLVRSLVQLQSIPRGFDTDNLIVVPFLVPDERHQDHAARVVLYREFIDEITQLPGVASATAIQMGPSTGDGGLSGPFVFEGQTPDDVRSNPWGTFDSILPGYFSTMAIPILRGRSFTEADRQGAPGVAIVSESVAQRYWPGQDPVGKRLRFTADHPWVEVVGVAGDTRYRELTKTWMTVYFSALQFDYFRPVALVVRSKVGLDQIAPALREAIQRREPRAAIVDEIRTMTATLDKETSRPRTASVVMGGFGLVAVLLAAIGIYGVLSYETTQRRLDLAIRCALGARPNRLFLDVMGRALSIVVVGLSVGVVMAVVLTRYLESLLFEVDPLDPWAFFSGAGLLLLVAVAAVCLPARRAATMDPVAVLRGE